MVASVRRRHKEWAVEADRARSRCSSLNARNDAMRVSGHLARRVQPAVPQLMATVAPPWMWCVAFAVAACVLVGGHVLLRLDREMKASQKTIATLKAKTEALETKTEPSRRAEVAAQITQLQLRTAYLDSDARSVLFVGFACDPDEGQWVGASPLWTVQLASRSGRPIRVTVLEWGSVMMGGGLRLCRYSNAAGGHDSDKIFDHGQAESYHTLAPSLVPVLLAALRPSLDSIVVRGTPAQNAMRALHAEGLLHTPRVWTFIPISRRPHEFQPLSGPPTTNFIPDMALPKPPGQRFASYATAHAASCAASGGASDSFAMYPASANKGQAQLIEALRKTTESPLLPLPPLVLAGGGTERYAAQIAGLGHALGNLSAESLLQRYCAAACVIAPASDRNPRVLYEAIALSKPVLYATETMAHVRIAAMGAGINVGTPPRENAVAWKRAVRQACTAGPERDALIKGALVYAQRYLLGEDAIRRFVLRLTERNTEGDEGGQGESEQHADRASPRAALRDFPPWRNCSYWQKDKLQWPAAVRHSTCRRSPKAEARVRGGPRSRP